MSGYICARCGRIMPRIEAEISGIGPLCHPDDPSLPDCYGEGALMYRVERAESFSRYVDRLLADLTTPDPERKDRP